MKKAINAWSVWSGAGFEELFAQLAEAGFDGVELNVDGADASAHSLTLETTKQELEVIRALSEQYALPVTGVSTSLYGGSLGSANREERAFGKRVMQKQLECAAALGAGGILTVPGGIGPEVSIQEAFATCGETYREMLETIGKWGIVVGVENVWNGFFLSPFDMARFIDELDCPLVGAYYDVGNVAAFSWPQHWIEVLGSRISQVHVKDFKRGGGLNSGERFVDLLQGDVEWPRVIQALRNAGFGGYLTAEVSQPKDPHFNQMEFYREVSGALEEIIANY